VAAYGEVFHGHRQPSITMIASVAERSPAGRGRCAGDSVVANPTAALEAKLAIAFGGAIVRHAGAECC
jgi:hypothetical protein